VDLALKNPIMWFRFSSNQEQLMQEPKAVVFVLISSALSEQDSKFPGRNYKVMHYDTNSGMYLKS
jgi:hypothetical protein